ncbi:MAG: T9SS type A sorting domain-containing protein [candidate division KSB1 bacterium]|nr:T9SS type A sorting domain-containing protein [candidate division KSB1 bacterium]
MTRKMLQITGVLMFLLLAVSLFAQESPSLILNTDYYNATRYTNARKIARSSDGTLMVSWEPNGTPGNEAHYAIWDADFEAWGDPVRLADLESGSSALVADDNGNIYASWKQRVSSSVSRRDYWFAKWDGATWTTPVICEEDTSNAGFGSMALAPNGDIFVTYTNYGTSWGPRKIHVCWSTDDGVSWSYKNLYENMPNLYSSVIEPCLTHDAMGNMLCLWYDETDTTNKTPDDNYPLKELMVSKYENGDWTDPMFISPMVADGDTLSSQYPTAATTSNGVVHIVYTSDLNHLWHSTWDGVTFSAPVQIDDSMDDMEIGRSGLSVDDNDNLYVVWQEETYSGDLGSIDNAFYSISKDGGMTWSMPVQMSNCTEEDGSGHSTEYPSLVKRIRGPIDGVFEGGAEVLWTQFNAASENGFDMWYYRIPLATTGVEQSNPNVIREYTLHQNYPNPFNPDTNIRFEIADAGDVELTIFNLIGQEVKTLVNEHFAPGSYTRQWDGTDGLNNIMPSGVYLYQLKTATFTQTRRMVFLR